MGAKTVLDDLIDSGVLSTVAGLIDKKSPAV
jgi:hypothetical protein